MSRFIDVLLVVGAASMIYFKKVTEDGAITADSIRYRADFVFFAAVVLGALGGVAMVLRGRLQKPTQTEFLVFGSLVTYLLFCVVATGLSLIAFDLRFDLIGISNALKTLLGIGLLIVTYVRLKLNGALYKWLAVALYLPPAIPLILGLTYLVSPAIYLTFVEDPAQIRTQVSLLSDAYRFQGLASNPFQVLISGSVAIAFLWPIVVDRLSRREWLVPMVGIPYIAGLAFLIFWTMTRTGLFVLLFVFLFAGLVATSRARKRVALISVTLTTAMIIVGAAASLMPDDFVAMYTSRFYSKDVSIGRSEYYTGGRAEIWTYFADVAARYPLGVGFNFEQKFFIDSSFQEKLNPHNMFLMAWMFGGVVAFVCVLTCTLVVVRWMRIQIRSHRGKPGFLHYLGAVTALLAVWMPFIGPGFGDFTQSILLALVLRGVPGATADRNAVNPWVAGVTSERLVFP